MTFSYSENSIFPHPSKANEHGVVAIGGNLNTSTLLDAYSHGIFPWYSPETPILWHSPDPRMILYPENLHVSRSMKKFLRKGRFTYSINQAFHKVIENCASIPRPGQDGTWIDEKMKAAYLRLHREGWAHSLEVWLEEKLVGGIYGVALGKAYFGESMFSKVPNASKAALIKLMRALEQKGFPFLDCQVYTPHLDSMGALEIPRDQFLSELKVAIQEQSLAKEEWNRLI